MANKKITYIYLIFLFSSCGTSFYSKRYQRGFQYGSRIDKVGSENFSVVNQANERKDDELAEFHHIHQISMAINECESVKDSLTFNVAQNDAVVSDVTFPQIDYFEDKATKHQEHAIIESLSSLSDEEHARKRYRQSLFMFIPIGTLVAMAIIFIFIPGAFIGMNIALTLAIPLLIIMINMAQQTRLYSSDAKLRRKAQFIQICGWVIFGCLFIIGFLGVFIGLKIGTISIF